MLELLTALFVLGLVLVGALALTSSNFRLEGIGSSRLVATNLAREGVELARSIRDSNWLAGEVFDAGLTNSNHCAVVTSMAQQSFVDHFAFQNCADVFDQSFQLYKSSDGRYYSDSSLGDPTQIYRLIRLDPICLVGNDEVVQTDTACDSDSEIGIAVHVDLGWRRIIKKMKLSLVEHLYDWQ